MQNLLHKLGVLATLFAASCAIYAQTRPRPLPITVHGEIRFANGGAPAANVLVRIESFAGGTEAEVITDRTGKYQFSGMRPGTYVITVHLTGFLDQRREVDLQTVTSEYVLFQLLPEKKDPGVNSAPVNAILNAKVPPEALLEFRKAQAALGEGTTKANEAVSHLQKAVAIYPDFNEAQLRLGTLYMDLGKWSKAEETLRTVLKIDPKSANAFFALGEVYLRLKDYAKAESILRQGLTVENRSWQGHFALGRVYWQEQEILKAAQQIALTIQLNPKHPEAHLLAGNIFLKVGRKKEALSEFDEYLRLEPKGRYATETKNVIQRISTPANK